MHITNLLNETFLVQRHAGGIKLIKPNNIEQSHICYSRNNLSLGELFTKPFHVYIEDRQNTILDLNPSCVSLYGFDTKESVIGRSLTGISSLDKRRFNNREIMRSMAYGIYHEVIKISNDKVIDIISIKFPWFTDNGKINGLLVCDLDINLKLPSSLAADFNHIISLFDATNPSNTTLSPNMDFLNQRFTKREVDVIQWVVRGKTMKEIAEITGLSTRTIESYFETIKKKADVKTKSQFIDKVINNSNK